jgi:hypothetical protein
MSFCDDVGWGWEGRDEILKIYVTFTLGLWWGLVWSLFHLLVEIGFFLKILVSALL